MTIKLIVGLSNPGAKYALTRHNAGAWYVQALVNHYQSTLIEEKKFYGYVSSFYVGCRYVYVLIPTTFMNLSGVAVLAMTNFYRIAHNEILVAHDELNLLPGIIQLKLGGGSNGHNGLKNIITNLGNQSLFYRLRIGIGNSIQKSKTAAFVLSEPSVEELQLINNTISKAVEYTESLINHNTENQSDYAHVYYFQ